MAFKKKNRDENVAKDPRGDHGSLATAVDRNRDREGSPADPRLSGDVADSRSLRPDAASNGGVRDAGGDVKQVRLGEQLVSLNLITEAQLDEALEMQREAGGRLGEVLVSIGALSEQSLAQALAAFFGFEVANLRRDIINPAVLDLITEDVARADDGLSCSPARRHALDSGCRTQRRVARPTRQGERQECAAAHRTAR